MWILRGGMQGEVRCWWALHKELKYLLESGGKLLQSSNFHRFKFICVVKAAERRSDHCHLCLGRMRKVCRPLLNFPLAWAKFFLLENASTFLFTRASLDKNLTWCAVCCGSTGEVLTVSALLVFQCYLLSQTEFGGDFAFFNVFWFYVTSYSRSLWIRAPRCCRIINTQYPGDP